MRSESSISAFSTPPSAKTTWPHHWNPEACRAGSHLSEPSSRDIRQAVRQHWTLWAAHQELCFTQLGSNCPSIFHPTVLTLTAVLVSFYLTNSKRRRETGPAFGPSLLSDSPSGSQESRSSSVALNSAQGTPPSREFIETRLTDYLKN